MMLVTNYFIDKTCFCFYKHDAIYVNYLFKVFIFISYFIKGYFYTICTY